MDKFINYMDRIEAEEDLKQRTKTAVLAAIENKNKRVLPMKRPTAAMVSIAATMMLLLGGIGFYFTPVYGIGLEINPSIQLGVNSFGRVVRAEGINEEGRNLVESQNLFHMPVELAIRELVEEAGNQGFIASDGSTVISVNALKGQQEKLQIIRNRAAAEAVSCLQENQWDAVVAGNGEFAPVRIQDHQRTMLVKVTGTGLEGLTDSGLNNQQRMEKENPHQSPAPAGNSQIPSQQQYQKQEQKSDDDSGTALKPEDGQAQKGELGQNSSAEDQSGASNPDSGNGSDGSGGSGKGN